MRTEGKWQKNPTMIWLSSMDAPFGALVNLRRDARASIWWLSEYWVVTFSFPLPSSSLPTYVRTQLHDWFEDQQEYYSLLSSTEMLEDERTNHERSRALTQHLRHVHQQLKLNELAQNLKAAHFSEKVHLQVATDLAIRWKSLERLEAGLKWLVAGGLRQFVLCVAYT